MTLQERLKNALADISMLTHRVREAADKLHALELDDGECGQLELMQRRMQADNNELWAMLDHYSNPE